MVQVLSLNCFVILTAFKTLKRNVELKGCLSAALNLIGNSKLNLHSLGGRGLITIGDKTKPDFT